MDFFNYKLFSLTENIDITVKSIIILALGYVFARVFSYIVTRILKTFFQSRNVDQGRSYTITTIVKYLIYVVVFFIALQLIGIQTYLWAGSAALLVGVGLGLQKTFNDFVCGIILLVDGTIEVGDVLNFEQTRGQVKYIGLRVSKIVDIENHIHIVPNSMIVNNKIENYTQHHLPTRFSLDVRVAYGTEPREIEQILLEILKPFNSYRIDFRPSIFLKSFEDYGMVFQLNFYTTEAFRIEKIKSDIRKEVAAVFIQKGINMPNPQRDIWIRSEKNGNKTD